MKYLRALIVAAGLVPAFAPSFATARPSYAAEQLELEDAANALSYRARLAVSSTADAATRLSDSNVTKANRLARMILEQTFSIAANVQEGEAVENLLQQLDDLEPSILQLDAAKRQLQSSYGNEKALIEALTNVRRNFYYLKELLSTAA